MRLLAKALRETLGIDYESFDKRADHLAAAASGIDVARYKLTAFVIAPGVLLLCRLIEF